MSKEQQQQTNLDWVKAEMGATQNQTSKFREKVLKNPFVPLGCFATAGCLMYGLWAFKSGDSKMSQLMMRYRIAAQAFTITAVITGVYLTLDQMDQKKKMEKLLQNQDK